MKLTTMLHTWLRKYHYYVNYCDSWYKQYPYYRYYKHYITYYMGITWNHSSPRQVAHRPGGGAGTCSQALFGRGLETGTFVAFSLGNEAWKRKSWQGLERIAESTGHAPNRQCWWRRHADTRVKTLRKKRFQEHVQLNMDEASTMFIICV